ncbi:DUF2092 domain-containing protein [Sphingomonas sp. NSE70-1]|uniref:DUF2092 domain-containing protein n=1 Tax=Sphingomonas caseinilyticus TaxID=2908205 RepID=A0ABT0RS70_9SPHN|nr:DUF2092 domain-containing protein [Sphingomonas caseinilyticus]MCL6697857.1 DUF2092 domain-containing protein [Sphingomonas caseinilyticus]
MTQNLCKALMSAAAPALILLPALSSCSKPAQENATEQAATETSATEQAGTEQAGAAQDESAKNAKGLLKAMADYLAAQKVISLSYDSVFEVVTDQQQKLQVATSGTVLLNRPDKVRTTRKSGFSDTEMVFDGKTLSFLGKGQNAYIQAEAPGTIDTLVEQLRDKFHRQLPGADFLTSNVYDELMTDVTDVKDLGSGVIDGKECDHLAFRAKDTDWQIWIAQGDTPYPCRYVITSKGVDQAPQFTMTIRDWNASAGAGQGDFSFTPPAGAKKLDIKDLAALKETSDLPENYKVGASK